MRVRGLLACLPVAALTLFAHAAPACAEGGAIPVNQCNSRQLVQRTYAVADLVVPIDMDNEPGKPADRTTREAELMSLILSAVAPDSWESVGGVGTLQYFPLGMALVVPYLGEHVFDIIIRLSGALFGPLLGLFLLGALVPRANAAGAAAGLLAGLASLAAIFPTAITPWWYGALTCLPTLLVGFLASLLFPPPVEDKVRGFVVSCPFRGVR